MSEIDIIEFVVLMLCSFLNSGRRNRSTDSNRSYSVSFFISVFSVYEKYDWIIEFTRIIFIFFSGSHRLQTRRRINTTLVQLRWKTWPGNAFLSCIILFFFSCLDNIFKLKIIWSKNILLIIVDKSQLLMVHAEITEIMSFCWKRLCLISVIFPLLSFQSFISFFTVLYRMHSVSFSCCCIGSQFFLVPLAVASMQRMFESNITNNCAWVQI